MCACNQHSMVSDIASCVALHGLDLLFIGIVVLGHVSVQHFVVMVLLWSHLVF